MALSPSAVASLTPRPAQPSPIPTHLARAARPFREQVLGVFHLLEVAVICHGVPGRGRHCLRMRFPRALLGAKQRSPEDDG